MTDRKPWEKTLKGKITYENDANDYYYEWYELHTDGGESLEDLIKTYLAENVDNDKPLTIKVRKGAIFLVNDELASDHKDSTTQE